MKKEFCTNIILCAMLVGLSLLLLLTAPLYAHPEDDQNCMLSVCHTEGGVTLVSNITGTIEVPPSSSFTIEIIADSIPATNLTMIWPMSTQFPVADNPSFAFSPLMVQDDLPDDIDPEIYRIKSIFEVWTPAAGGDYTIQVFAAGGPRRAGTLILNLTLTAEGMPQIEMNKDVLKLLWPESTDTDFARYEIFRSESEGVLGASIAQITDKATTSFEVRDLLPETSYYFTLREWNTGGQYSDSVQIRAKTQPLPPAVPLWQQPWFIALVAAVVVAIVLVAIFLLKRTRIA